MTYRAYVLYGDEDEPIGFNVCSLQQSPVEKHKQVGEADTQEEAETMAEDAYIDALFEWANAGL